MTDQLPDMTLERELRSRGYRSIAGIDEAGRGALAGPVVAAAVVLDLANIPAGLNDSKKLSWKRREELYEEIHALARVAFASVSTRMIEEINVLAATMKAMTSACGKLSSSPDYVLVDGNQLPRDLGSPAHSVTRGDTLSVSIAAASIIAKVERDRMMIRLAEDFPAYGWHRNKGYGTAGHMEAISAAGITCHHRRTFAPVKAFDVQDRLY